MLKKAAALSYIFCFLLLGACSTLEFPKVYRLPIEQGNIITGEMVAQLKPGMSKSQVEFIMGTPLIRDTFHPDRWDYIHSLRRPDGDIEQERLTAFFENDRLVRFTSTVKPGERTAIPDSETAKDTGKPGAGEEPAPPSSFPDPESETTL